MAKFPHALMALWALCTTGLLAQAAAADSLPGARTLQLSDASPVVQSAIQTQLAGGTLNRIQQTEQMRKVLYEVDVTTKEGQSRSFTLSANGTLQDIKVSLAETPAAVQQTINQRLNGGRVESILKSFDDDDINYDVKTVAAGGPARQFTVEDSGRLASIEIALGEAPPDAQKTIKQQVADGQLLSLEKEFDYDGTYFYGEVLRKDGQQRDFSVGLDGKLQEAELDLSEAPVVVQAAINKHLSAARLESIEKSFDDEDGITYDVYAVSKMGREWTFTVNPKGTLLSTEVTLDQIPEAVQKTIHERLGGGKVRDIEKSYVEKDGVLPYDIYAEKDGKEYNFSVGPLGRFLGMD